MDRRNFLAASGAGVSAMQGWAHAGPCKQEDGPIFDITDFGAVGNGVHDDTEAINCAVKNAINNHGGIVFFPPGTFLISREIKIDSADPKKNIQIKVQGCGWGKVWKNAASADGTWILIKNHGFSALYIGRGSGSTISDLGFVYGQPGDAANWRPGAFPHTVVVENGRDVRLSRLYLFNSTKGILFFNTGGTVAEGVIGNPLEIGIEIDRCEDVVKVDDVHFWRFWEETLTKSHRKKVEAWRVRHGVGIESMRADNPHYSRIFVIGYKKKGFNFCLATGGLQANSP